MGMGPGFIPRRRERRELLRRARKLLQTSGVVEIATNGVRISHAATELVRVHQDNNKGVTIRFYQDVGHPLMSWPRVLSSDWNGYERLWNEDLLAPALEHLRSLQVLDDLSQA